MLGEQPACLPDPVNDAFRELALPKMLAHHSHNVFPKCLAALGMHRFVSDDGKVL